MAKKGAPAIVSGVGIGLVILISLMVQAPAFAVCETNRLFLDVNYALPLSDMIRDGKFDRVNPDIAEKSFPIHKRSNSEVEMKLFDFTNPDIEFDEVIREMDRQGYRPAELPEALAYAKANPDEQRKYPIAIPGSILPLLGGSRCIPCLVDWYGSRKLDLLWYGPGYWSLGWFRFLGVRK